jgi:hypothetical protein
MTPTTTTPFAHDAARRRTTRRRVVGGPALRWSIVGPTGANRRDSAVAETNLASVTAESIPIPIALEKPSEFLVGLP